MKVLALDIETRPATVLTWKLYQPIISIEQVIDAGGMFAFGAKWVGKRGVEFHSDFHDGHDAMVKRVWDLLDEADSVLHFNGNTFDVPHVQRCFMEAGMGPPSPFKQIDLLRTVRKQAMFLSNKLGHVAPQLGLKGKIENEGFALWRKCMAGDEKAWGRMQRYCKRDVTELEEAYEILRPWVPSHPSHAAFSGERVCTRCGADERHLEKRGFATLTTGRYQRLHCVKCGSWSRDNKRLSSASVVAL